MEIKKRIEELKNNMNDESIDLVMDYAYSSMYICDSITEAADASVSIYYNDLEYIIELAALAYIQNVGYETIADDAYTVIMEELATIDNDNYWDDIIDAIDKHCAIPAM